MDHALKLIPACAASHATLKSMPAIVIDITLQLASCRGMKSVTGTPARYPVVCVLLLRPDVGALHELSCCRSAHACPSFASGRADDPLA